MPPVDRLSGGAMNRINTSGVIAGGLVAGLIINISQTLLNMPVVGARMQAELAARNLPNVEGAAIGIFVALCFMLGLVTVWCTPRCGPVSAPARRPRPASAS